MSDTVIREVCKGVWTFSRPFARFGVWPIGGRSTAIQLNDGGVWVLASTPLNPDTKAKLDELGPVKFIIGPDSVHHLFIGEFQRAYPDAKLFIVEEAIKRHSNEKLRVDGVWGKDPPKDKFGFEDEIRSCWFAGSQNKDVAFFHPASKVLIQADLLFNLPPLEQYSKMKSSGRIPLLSKLFSPYSSFQANLMWIAGVDKEAMKRDAKTVADWDFEKIIPCHGDVVEEDGNKAWRAAYKYYLD